MACVFLVLAADIAWRPGWESDGCSAMVQFAFSHYAGVVEVIFRNNRLRSVGAWIWNRGQDLWILSLPVLIVLKLTGVIAWSWWWVLSPLWISGILLAPVLCALLVLLGWHIYRARAASNAYGGVETVRDPRRTGSAEAHRLTVSRRWLDIARTATVSEKVSS